jgi:hypothetical protein
MAESASGIQASGRTGDNARQIGPYRSDSRVALVVFFRSGDRFPSDAEGRSTTWTLVTERPNDRDATT